MNMSKESNRFQNALVQFEVKPDTRLVVAIEFEAEIQDGAWRVVTRARAAKRGERGGNATTPLDVASLPRSLAPSPSLTNVLFLT